MFLHPWLQQPTRIFVAQLPASRLCQVGDGVDARFEFEFVELQPVWNEASAGIGDRRCRSISIGMDAWRIIPVSKWLVSPI